MTAVVVRKGSCASSRHVEMGVGSLFWDMSRLSAGSSGQGWGRLCRCTMTCGPGSHAWFARLLLAVS